MSRYLWPHITHTYTHTHRTNPSPELYRTTGSSEKKPLLLEGRYCYSGDSEETRQAGDILGWVPNEVPDMVPARARGPLSFVRCLGLLLGRLQLGRGLWKMVHEYENGPGKGYIAEGLEMYHLSCDPHAVPRRPACKQANKMYFLKQQRTAKMSGVTRRTLSTRCFRIPTR